MVKISIMGLKSLEVEVGTILKVLRLIREYVDSEKLEK